MADEEIRHLVRIMNTDLQGNQPVIYALTGIRGIGIRTSKIIVDSTGIDPNGLIGYLSDEDVAKLDSAINNFEGNMPKWMLNRQKDPLTGDDKHLLGQDIMLTLREDINTLKKIRAYRGLRHERGLKVRGQRTKSTGRRGSTIGVSKKK
ncbi:30S ribosomal protein S13 [Methanolobus zinderi]|jgi:small subunit ribosomal protein S13|uniref:Small ribosomal subunit protein uS13 n=1 Tax=Methanolobus zinderi TaxID=536044 RepID=A0A7D5IN11_9EURY|nr:30S ribosomal protein S13 [Methanolobus zinderi]KXS41482.1 MAG: small subunit ribosomal protein S13 [Methanolobus sp. T82-4]QLC49305.1 30S ribosomal protein S13 [Methanolobus zinderi]